LRVIVPLDQDMLKQRRLFDYLKIDREPLLTHRRAESAFFCTEVLRKIAKSRTDPHRSWFCQDLL